MLGKLDPISRLVKHASGLQLPPPTAFPTIVVRCRPILSADSYYYPTQQFVETGLYRFGKGSECAVARGITATRPPSAKLHSAVNAPVIPASLFVTKISASLARHSRIPAAVCAKRWVRHRVTTALRTGSDAAYNVRKRLVTAALASYQAQIASRNGRACRFPRGHHGPKTGTALPSARPERHCAQPCHA